MTSNLCLLKVKLNDNKEDIQSSVAGPWYVPNIYNICYTKRFQFLTLNVRLSFWRLYYLLKVKNYFAVWRRTEKRCEYKVTTFSLKKTRKINARFLNLWLEMDQLGEELIKLKSRDPQMNWDFVPWKSLPCSIKVKVQVPLSYSDNCHGPSL